VRTITASTSGIHLAFAIWFDTCWQHKCHALQVSYRYFVASTYTAARRLSTSRYNSNSFLRLFTAAASRSAGRHSS